MCQVWMRHVVCKAHEGFLENVALVYLQQICTLQNVFFFPPWNSIDILIWKHRFKMYSKLDSRPWNTFSEKQSIFRLENKGTNPHFLSSSRRILSQLWWVCTSFQRFVEICLKKFFIVLLSTSVFCTECQPVLKYLLKLVWLEGLPIVHMLKCMEDFTGQGWHLLPF